MCVCLCVCVWREREGGGREEIQKNILQGKSIFALFIKKRKEKKEKKHWAMYLY